METACKHRNKIWERQRQAARLPLYLPPRLPTERHHSLSHFAPTVLVTLHQSVSASACCQIGPYIKPSSSRHPPPPPHACSRTLSFRARTSHVGPYHSRRELGNHCEALTTDRKQCIGSKRFWCLTCLAWWQTHSQTVSNLLFCFSCLRPVNQPDREKRKKKERGKMEGRSPHYQVKRI